jgi:hypothetical protein
MVTHLLHLGSPLGVGLLTGTLVEFLVLGINVHGDLQELLVEERNSSLETPGHGRLVGSETVGSVQVLDSLDTFLVEVLGVRRSVEVEVPYLSVITLHCCNDVDLPPKISSDPSPERTILTPIALIFRDKRYMGVEARTVVTSKVSRW